MPTDEGLGPRKTMFVLVVVVGCFAMLWPRILSPLMLGGPRDQMKPNQFDRDAGCCDIIFTTDMAVHELLSEVCSSTVGADGKLSPYAAAECRKAVNVTCGMDIADFLKRNENVGKNTRKLIDVMKSSNSSCLKEHFGVSLSFNVHTPLNSWSQSFETIKQERPLARGQLHPALRERGRAIPAGTPTPPSRVTPPINARVRSPLEHYFEVQPPPIPGMRPPLGGAGGPVPAPKSSMGFVMPIYTLCIVVFFVYTLSKILFKRTGPASYEVIEPDPQFRRHVFKEDSRSTPEAKLVVTAISGLVAEVRDQMEASYVQSQQRAQDDSSRPYTNGKVLHDSTVKIIATEYVEPEKNPIEIGKVPERESDPEENDLEITALAESIIDSELKEITPNEPIQQNIPEKGEFEYDFIEENDSEEEIENVAQEEIIEEIAPKQPTPEPEIEILAEKNSINESETAQEDNATEPHSVENKLENIQPLELDLMGIKHSSDLAEATAEFISEARQVKKQLTPELIAEALKEYSGTEEESEEEVEEEVEEEEEEVVEEKPDTSVKVLGMEVTAHSADGGAWRPPRPTPPPRRPHETTEVKSIYLEGDIPQQSRVLVAEFKDQTDKPEKDKAPLVVSGKMTLSLIQDAPKVTPDRELESTVDDFTTASAITQPADENEELSEEETEEEIEVEEIEEEVEEEDEEVIRKIKK